MLAVQRVRISGGILLTGNGTFLAESGRLLYLSKAFCVQVIEMTIFSAAVAGIEKNVDRKKTAKKKNFECREVIKKYY
ncbi:hypothetical protein [Maridesulfovibrio sp.]|nr:hypothetical protein [Maridesulfovibrio sp.]